MRDRLEADYNIHKKNKDSVELKFAWVSPKDHGLFDFLGEHRALIAANHDSNWFSIFTNVVDLKASLRRHFEPVIKPQVLLRAIQENRFPLFSRNLDAEYSQFGAVPSIKCRMVLKNVGLVPAFELKTHWHIDGHKCEITDIVPPNQEFYSTLIANAAYGDVSVLFTVEYRSGIGVTVREQYKVNCFVRSGTIISGATLETRTYHNAPPPMLTIDDA